ncbi:Asp23/Gls24 family envelope stress response protein [Nocardiopsis sp. HNM0947]|uniref:Asp23/Gls24 family envelope stress response protein n=1 Tax=Nocardiopsis coralli TaxID=2772213 RepID=A0ABR9P2A0_9ACTN|nr:Asp23/Gls24 family envelope stress response protein [Nocardiopsis coralli]MBE2997890.1 Asp23/Gls24 family envelope stress response protein [Nocardiopsis coralli]
MSNASNPQTAPKKSREENPQNEHEQRVLRGPLQTEQGITTLEDTVVAKIAGVAARDVPGVHDMGNAARRAFSAVTDRIPNSQTNVAGGISVEKGEVQTAIDVTVVVEYGASIVDVGNAIRRNIIDQVEGTTGLEVIEVNVNVVDVHLPQEDENPSQPKREIDLQ